MMSFVNRSTIQSSLVALACAFSLMHGGRVASAQITQPNLGGAGTLNPYGDNAVNLNKPRRNDPNTMGPIAVPEDFDNLKLAPGFLLSLQVFDEPSYTSDLRIGPKGDITIPTIGAVHVAGSTLSEAQSAVEKRFQEAKILNNPQVTLDIEQYAGGKITVLGEVQTPGRVELLTDASLEDVLSRVGGETNLAGNTIQIKRVEDGKETQQTVTYLKDAGSQQLKSVMIHPGDTVVVQRAGIVYVLGAVGKPGGYVMQEDGKLNVMQAIALADGTTLAAAIKSMRVVRKDPSGNLQEIKIDYRNMTKGKEPPLTLQAEDIVYVPQSKVKNVLTAGLVSSTSAAAIYTH